MKKNTKKLMAAGLLCAIALTLTACGTKTDEPKAANASTPASGKVTGRSFKQDCQGVREEDRDQGRAVPRYNG